MPNTLAIANEIVTLLQGLQYQSAPLYKLVKLGAIQDPTDSTPGAGVFFDTGQTKRFDSGWKVNDHPGFKIESIMDLNNATTTEQFLLDGIRDVVIPFFIKQVSLQSTPGVYVTFLGDTDRAFYSKLPNGIVYRFHWMWVRAVQQYNVQLAL
jgi:hypothetical protein